MRRGVLGSLLAAAQTAPPYKVRDVREEPLKDGLNRLGEISRGVCNGFHAGAVALLVCRPKRGGALVAC